MLEFLGTEVLFGSTRLRIFSSTGDTLYNFTWEVSNYFWKEDSRYLDESQRIQKFWNIFDHTLDESSFSPMSDLKITGLIYSTDEDFARDITSDSTNVGLLLNVQDYCIAFSKKYNKAIRLRAIRKSILKKYNLL
ncbi:MAG: hypothetical protein JSS79_20540 [Bacteroidetes bacterium]|nr:hypothetical protein [Bacteroidota bacterium]